MGSHCGKALASNHTSSSAYMLQGHIKEDVGVHSSNETAVDFTTAANNTGDCLGAKCLHAAK